MELTAQGHTLAAYGLQADYFQFVYGAVALILAALCFLRAGSRRSKKIGRALVLFALLQGIAGWLEIFTWSLLPHSLKFCVAVLGLLSYAALGRAAWLYRSNWKSVELRREAKWAEFVLSFGLLLFLTQVVLADFPALQGWVLRESAAPISWIQVALLTIMIFMAAFCLPAVVSRKEIRLSLAVAFLALLLCGEAATDYIARDTDSELRENLQSQAKIAAVAVQPEWIALFDNFMSSGDRADYHFVNPELQAIRKINLDIKSIYLTVLRQGEIVFAYSSEEEAVSGNEAGRRYKRYPPELLQAFSSGRSATVGPYTDEWGSFVSAFAVVGDSSGPEINAVLGIDLDAADWQKTVFRHRLAPICITLLFFIIGLIYFVNRQRLLAAMAQTAASEERFALAMQGANDGLWDWDLTTGEVYFSPQWRRMMGLSLDETGTGLKQWAELLHPEDRDQALEELRDYLQGRVERLEYEVRMRHRDGHYLDVLARAFAVRKGQERKPVRLVGTQVDITEKNATARALAAAKAEAEQAARARSAFLANMSHEIRTPIHAILGFTQLMQQDANLTQQQRDHMLTIRHNGEYLLAIINEVLEMAKLEAAKPELHQEVFELSGLLLEIAPLFNGQMQEKGLHYSCNGLAALALQVRADKQKLRQILINLMGNAVKFTEAGQIHVTARLEKDTATAQARLVWEVMDSGPGVAEEDRERIFIPFVQAAFGAKIGGTGLGLAISREYARLMGGDITMTSWTGKGSVFRFEVPLELATEFPANEAVAPLYPLRRVEEGPVNIVDSASLTGLPPDLVSELRDAVVRARIDECEVLIERLRLVCPITAERLLGQLRRYEYGKVLAFLQGEQKKTDNKSSLIGANKGECADRGRS